MTLRGSLTFVLVSADKKGDPKSVWLYVYVLVMNALFLLVFDVAAIVLVVIDVNLQKYDSQSSMVNSVENRY